MARLKSKSFCSRAHRIYSLEMESNAFAKMKTKTTASEVLLTLKCPMIPLRIIRLSAHLPDESRKPLYLGFKGQARPSLIIVILENRRTTGEPVVTGRHPLTSCSLAAFPNFGSSHVLHALKALGMTSWTSHTVNSYVTCSPLGSQSSRVFLLILSGPGAEPCLIY